MKGSNKQLVTTEIVTNKVKAFTLIELLAVIAVLAIVLLIAVPTIIDMIEKARLRAFRDNALGALRSSKDYIDYFNIGEEDYDLEFDEDGMDRIH